MNNPWILTALPLVAIPFLIHLLNRKRARPHAYAAMDFIRRSLEHAKRHLKLKSLVLLALRTLAVLLLILALSGMQCSRRIVPTATTSRSVVVLLDLSASMRFVSKSGDTLAEIGKKKALDLIDSLELSDDAAWVAFDEKFQGSRQLDADRGAIRRQIGTLTPGFRKAQLGPALQEALRILSQSSQPRREIHVFSDLAHGGFVRSEFPTRQDLEKVAGLRVVVHDLQPETAPGNLWLDDLSLREDLTNADQFVLQSSLRATGSLRQVPGQEIPVILFINGKEVSRSFQKILPSGEPSRIEFSFGSRESRAGAGRISIRTTATEEGLQADNDRYFSFSARQKPSVLLVDGDPQPQVSRSESFYLQRAFAALSGESSAIDVLTRTAQELQPADWKGRNLIVLANVNGLQPSAVELLRRFVSEGGGLLVTLGSQVDAEKLNSQFADFLPGRLRDIRVEEKGVGFAAIPVNHPLLRGLSSEDLSFFEFARFERYFVLESALAANAEVLLRFATGSPALLTRSFGRGRVALFTSSMDRDWTSFPLQTTFVAFVRLLSLDLISGLHRIEPKHIPVAREAQIAAPTSALSVRWTNPAGKSETKSLSSPGEKLLRFHSEELSEPGYYRVEFFDAKRLPQGESAILVHVDPEESDLRKISAEELETYLPKSMTAIREAKGDANASDADFAGAGSLNLLPYLLAALLLVILSETLVENAA